MVCTLRIAQSLLDRWEISVCDRVLRRPGASSDVAGVRRETRQGQRCFRSESLMRGYGKFGDFR